MLGLSCQRAAVLVQQLMQGLPELAQLAEVLFQPPVAKLPVFPAVLAGLYCCPGNLASMCEPDDGSTTSLALPVSLAMRARGAPWWQADDLTHC